jgi:8-oxo-dGTP pyrophosphatase MutT (NUDIX family)
LCRVPPWRMTGASALVCLDDGLLLEVVKPGHWRMDATGVTHIGLGAIGGSLAGDETLMDCLQREAQEELGTELQILPATETGFCADEQTASRLLPQRVLDYPAPCLFTVGANRYRAGEAEAPTLAIATFWARPLAPVVWGDLFGTLLLPWDGWTEVLAALPQSLPDLCVLPGVRLETQGAVPPDALLHPEWTVHTLQQVLRAGALERPGIGQ